jgi:hypothetical protein
MHEIFSVIPQELFQPLSAPKGPIYLETAYRVWNSSRSSGGKLGREMTLQIAREVYQDSAMASIRRMAEDNRVANPADQPLSLDGLLADAVKVLVEAGWLVESQDEFFRVMYSLSLPGIHLLEFFRRLQSGVDASLDGVIISIYDGLGAAVHEEQERHQRIESAAINGILLLQGIERLSAQMQRYVRDLRPQAMSSEMLRVAGDQYRKEVGERFQTLMTTENASRYRPGIRGYAHTLLETDSLRLAAVGANSTMPSQSIEEHEERLRNSLGQVLEAMETVDSYLEELRRSNKQFWETVNNLMRAASLMSVTMRGRVREFARRVITEEESLPAGIINLRSLQVIDNRSLRGPRKRAPEFEVASSPPPILSEEQRDGALAVIRMRELGRFGRTELEHFLQRTLAGLLRVRASELTDLPVEPVLVISKTWELMGTYNYHAQQIADAPWVLAGSMLFRDFYIYDKQHPEFALEEAMRVA